MRHREPLLSPTPTLQASLLPLSTAASNSNTPSRQGTTRLLRRQSGTSGNRWIKVSALARALLTDNPVRHDRKKRSTMNMKPTIRDWSDIFADFERGLAQKEFFFVFQPKLSSQDARISGFESLMRWQHPVNGVLEPSSFISVVEHSELAGHFTDLLLEKAIDTLASWKSRGHTNLTLAVNLPAPELARADLPSKLTALLAAREVEACRLQIELTEVVEPAKLDSLADAIHAVRASGVSVALDDFGAGFTSLTLLHQLPANIIKIDRSYIRNVPEDAESRFVMETLVQLGQRLGKQIVVKGIETEAQFKWAQALPHVDCQGYYISRPVSEALIEQLLAYDGHIYDFERSHKSEVN
jgi:EAL domain-containing protein (putative c-di-GMP-specific phosphodiesterase class I)